MNYLPEELMPVNAGIIPKKVLVCVRNLPFLHMGAYAGAVLPALTLVKNGHKVFFRTVSSAPPLIGERHMPTSSGVETTIKKIFHCHKQEAIFLEEVTPYDIELYTACLEESSNASKAQLKDFKILSYFAVGDFDFLVNTFLSLQDTPFKEIIPESRIVRIDTHINSLVDPSLPMRSGLKSKHLLYFNNKALSSLKNMTMNKPGQENLKLICSLLNVNFQKNFLAKTKQDLAKKISDITF